MPRVLPVVVLALAIVSVVVLVVNSLRGSVTHLLRSYWWVW